MRLCRFLILTVTFSFCGLTLAQAGQQRPTPIKDAYLKAEYMIPMRDGVKLYTAVYVPKDDSGKHPIMLTRTPYSAGPYGPDNFKSGFGGSQKFVSNNYIFAFQDVRGKYMSEGDFVNVRPMISKLNPNAKIDESTDTYDTIEYLIKNVQGNNGRVGIWGISYPGFYAGASVVNSHPALKAVSPQAPVSNWWIGDDFHHNGAFFMMDAFNFLGNFGQPRPEPTATPKRGPAHDKKGDAYQFFLDLGPLSNANDLYFKNEVAFWNELFVHPNYDDYWKARALPDHVTGVKCAVMTTGGWYDAEDLWGALYLYRGIEQKNPNATNTIVMGPWFHGGWHRSNGSSFGGVNFGIRTSDWYMEEVEFPFFDSHLRGDGSYRNPEAIMFVGGRNQWAKFDVWPPKDAKATTFFFHGNRRISTSKPSEVGPAFDEYTNDPANPTPYIAEKTASRTREYMIDDQVFAEKRADVLTYRTETLLEDWVLAGPVNVDLYVQTTGTDADFVVKVIDEAPGGSQRLVRAEIMRSKFRDDPTHPKPLKANSVERVRYTMPDLLYGFQRGHRLMIQVQSNWFPLADRNPNQFLDIYRAKANDYIKAQIQIHRSAQYPSSVSIGRIGKYDVIDTSRYAAGE
ncbi:MAG: CocE/NonD family hydrolase [Fimbriimonadaceae bacterium]|nr:CocE/NonD family hydrolase [Fimbriimonadaceae bacterium]